MDASRPEVPTRRLDRPFPLERVSAQLRLSALWFAGNALWEALLSVVLPFLVLRAVGNAHKALALSALATAGTLLASAVHPVAGWASDRTYTRWGRRRPFVLVGGIGSFVALTWLAVGQGYAELVGAVLLLQLAYNVAIAAYQAYIPEIAPPKERGRSSGFLGLMSSLGALAGAIGAVFLLNGQTYPYLLLGLGALLLAAVAVTVWGLPEALPSRAAARPVGPRLSAYRDFGWVLLTRALVMLAFYTLLTYLAYYLRDVAHLADYTKDTSYVVAVTILTAACTAVWAGRRSDVLGRRALVCAAGVLMGLGAAAFLLVHGLGPILAVGAVFGAGYGVYIAVDWALISDVLPDPTGVARDMGIWGLAITVPQVLAPLVGGGLFLLLPHGTVAYEWVFGLTCLYALVGSALVWQVRGVR